MEKVSEQMSICRLELLAALLAVKIRTFVKTAFELPLTTKYFSDSQVTLHRLKNDHSIYRPFVANRLKQISELTNVDEWYYVRTDINIVADLCSRGSRLSDFIHNARYWHGPEFLLDGNHNYDEMNIKTIQMKKNIKQIEEEEKRITKPTCLTFGDPTFDCGNAGDHNKVSLFSHQLCLEGNAKVYRHCASRLLKKNKQKTSQTKTEF